MPGTRHTSILARIGETAAKLALVVAVGRDPAAPRIELGDAEWAIDGWREQGLLAVSVDDERLGWPERERVRQLGEKPYGIRREEKTHGVN